MKLFLCFIFLVVPVAFAVSEGGSSSEASKTPLPPPKPAGPENINTYLHLQVNNLTKSQPPRVWDRKLILTFTGDPNARYVAAAFEHEEFRVKHVFFKNQNSVYFLVMDLPEDSPDQLRYRLIVDGLWQSDPSNSHNVRNDQGTVLSTVDINDQDKPRMTSPVQKYQGEVEFRFKGRSGLQIAIMGNFNNWDPYSYYLEEESGRPGEYSLKVSLPPGPVYYQYVVGTKTLLDPLNSHTAYDQTGMAMSYFENKVMPKPLFLEAKMADSLSNESRH